MGFSGVCAAQHSIATQHYPFFSIGIEVQAGGGHGTCLRFQYNHAARFDADQSLLDCTFCASI